LIGRPCPIDRTDGPIDRKSFQRVYVFFLELPPMDRMNVRWIVAPCPMDRTDLRVIGKESREFFNVCWTFLRLIGHIVRLIGRLCPIDRTALRLIGKESREFQSLLDNVPMDRTYCPIDRTPIVLGSDGSDTYRREQICWIPTFRLLLL
jgi:uncharacterized protein YbaR (Trm112 family)